MKCAKDGCRAPAGASSGLCFWHDPDRRKKMINASKKGGSHNTAIIDVEKVETLDDLRCVLGTSIKALLKSKGDLLQRLRLVGYLSAIMSDIIQVSDLEARIELIEKSMQSK